MREFTHVQQRTSWDCGIACIAMMAGTSYLQAADKFSVLKGFMDSAPLNGLQVDTIVGCLAFGFGIPANTCDGLIEPVPGILQVPSLNNPGTLHYVFWTGKEVLDPAKGRKIGENFAKVHDRFTIKLGVTRHIYSPIMIP